MNQILKNFTIILLFGTVLLVLFISLTHTFDYLRSDNFQQIIQTNISDNKQENITTKPNPKKKGFDIFSYNSENKARIWDDYIDYHNKVSSAEYLPHFLVVETSPRVGLGNRLEEIQAGLLVALLSGRALLVVWEEPFPISDYLNTSWPFSWNFFSVYPNGRGDSSRVEVPENGELIVLMLEDQFQSITEDMLWFTYPNMMHFPYQAIYDHPLYADLIPQLFGEWKTTLFSQFLRPINPIMELIVNLKKTMQPYDALITIHIRTEMIWWTAVPYAKQEETIPDLIKKHLDCVKFFKEQLENSGKRIVQLFLASDYPLAFSMARAIWNESLFHVTNNPMHTANSGDHYTDQLHINKDLDEYFNVMIDWWMIGEGNVMVVSDKSSFSFTAAVRSTNKRFTVGEKTQCTHANEEGYLEEIYKPTLESWNEFGRMKHYTLQR